MRKSEMTNEQLAIRQQIIKCLTEAGWTEGEAISGFHNGEFVLEEAVMEYHRSMDITVSYMASKDTIILIMECGLGGSGVTLEIKYPIELSKLLDFIISFQDKVTEHNFRDYIVTIVDFCSDVYVDLGDQGLVRLDNKARRKDSFVTQ